MNVLMTLQEILIKDYKIAREDLAPGAHLDALGIDSLSLLELMFKIEDNFHVKIPGDPPTDLATVQDVCTYVEGLIVSQHSPVGTASDAAVKP